MYSYFLANRLISTTSIPPLWDEVVEANLSMLFMCPTCGETWGRIVVPHARWICMHSGCRKHPQWMEDVGGTFIRPWRKTYMDLPIEVLAYELDIRLANFKDQE